jgi:hypothetical protein
VSNPAIVVFGPLDIVFPEVIPGLHFIVEFGMAYAIVDGMATCVFKPFFCNPLLATFVKGR